MRRGGDLRSGTNIVRQNGCGAIMFLLGFISKRVINYTTKYK